MHQLHLIYKNFYKIVIYGFAQIYLRTFKRVFPLLIIIIIVHEEIFLNLSNQSLPYVFLYNI